MGVLVVAFLIAAKEVAPTAETAALLVLAAVLTVPLFLAVIVLMFTRFRTALLGDHEYVAWKKFEAKRFAHFQAKVVPTEASAAISGLPDSIERRRIDRYVANQGLFLVYDWRPTDDLSEADIVVRLAQHVSPEGLGGPLIRGEVESVEYYLGPNFGGGRPIMIRDPDENFRLDVRAYRPVLCVASVHLRAKRDPLFLEQYLYFQLPE